jgi:Mg2+ and Co2+ transporter CorA
MFSILVTSAYERQRTRRKKRKVRKVLRFWLVDGLISRQTNGYAEHHESTENETENTESLRVR